MIEAQIICSNPCDIPDLGIVGLKRGEERWVSIITAESSADLRKERIKGNVRVYRKVRRMEKTPKRPPPPFVLRSRPAVPEKPEPKLVDRIVEVERIEVVRQEVDTEELAQQVKAKFLQDLLPELQAVIAEEVGRGIAAQEARQAVQEAPEERPGLDRVELESVLESVLRRVLPDSERAISTPDGAEIGGIEEPIFIPRDVVKKDVEAKIEVRSKEVEGGGELDDAQTALRALKRKKRDETK